MPRDQHGGTVLRGPDGSLYFIRDELLDALRVQGEGLDKLNATLKKNDANEVAAAAAAGQKGGQTLQTVAYVKGSLLMQDKRNADLAAGAEPAARAALAQPQQSTIMCPWFC